MTYLGGGDKVGEIPLPPNSVLDIQAIRIAFFDWCLKRSSPRFDEPRVRVYLTGADRWVDADRYPCPTPRSGSSISGATARPTPPAATVG